MERGHRRGHSTFAERLRGPGGGHRIGGEGQERHYVPVAEQLRAWTSPLSVGRAAALLGIGRAALSAVFNGRAALSIELAFKMERRCGLDARRLLHEQLDEQIDRFMKTRRKR